MLFATLEEGSETVLKSRSRRIVAEPDVRVKLSNIDLCFDTNL